MKRSGRAMIVNALLIVGAVLTAFPLLWMLSVSFMPTGAASTYPPPLLPAEPTLENYRQLFANHNAGRYMLNSAIVASQRPSPSVSPRILPIAAVTQPMMIELTASAR